MTTWGLTPFKCGLCGQEVTIAGCKCPGSGGSCADKDVGTAHDTFTGAKVNWPTITVSDPHGDLLREIRDLLREIRDYSETTADYLAGLYDRGSCDGRR